MSDTLLTIQIHQGETGLFYATSPERPELFVGARTLYGALDAVPEVLRAISRCRTFEEALVAGNATPES